MDDPLTDAELSFQELLHDPARYSRWAAQARARWEKTPDGKANVARCYRTVGGFRQGEERKRAG